MRIKGKIQIWQDTLDKFRRKLENGFKEALKVSYGSLDEETRQIFLDITCFSLEWIRNFSHSCGLPIVVILQEESSFSVTYVWSKQEKTKNYGCITN